MQRIYLPNTQFSSILELSQKDVYHQITRVLRARVGQEYIFFDGEYLIDHIYKISQIDAKKVIFTFQDTQAKNSETFPTLHLFQALPNKLEKVEYIIQKSCEVGYRSITFFPAERSQKLVLSEQKKERLEKIAIEAIEQCGGNIIPDIEFLTSSPLNLLSFKGEEGYNIICHTNSEESKMLSELSMVESINIFVGPEGGFSPQEIENFSAQKVYFGERILRCETVSSVVGFYLQQKTQD